MIVEYCDEIEHNVTTSEPYSTTTSEPIATTPSNGSTTQAPIDLGQCSDDNMPSVYGIPNTCQFLFYQTSMTDQQVGIILLIVSLALLCTALVVIVKILNSLLRGKKAFCILKNSIVQGSKVFNNSVPQERIGLSQLARHL